MVYKIEFNDVFRYLDKDEKEKITNNYFIKEDNILFVKIKVDKEYYFLKINQDLFSNCPVKDLEEFLNKIIFKFEEKINEIKTKIGMFEIIDLDINKVKELFLILDHVDILLFNLDRYIEICEKLKRSKNIIKAKKLMKELNFLNNRLENIIQVYSLYSDLKNRKLLDRISIIAFLFLIPSTIFGMYGMNFRYIPFYDHPYGFTIVVILSFLLVFILYWLLIKKMNY